MYARPRVKISFLWGRENKLISLKHGKENDKWNDTAIKKRLGSHVQFYDCFCVQSDFRSNCVRDVVF